MKARRIAGIIGVVTVSIGVLAGAGCSTGQATTATTAGAQGSAQTSTQNSVAGSSQVLPVAKNPIVNTSTKAGLEIVSAMAENNVDPVTKKNLSDCLQFTLKNTSTETLSDIEVYYEMKDTTTQKTEGYYQKLTGFSLAPAAQGTVYFDNGTGVGHYPENTFSLYRISTKEVVLSIEASAAGYAPAMGQAVKAVGTGEKAGQ